MLKVNKSGVVFYYLVQNKKREGYNELHFLNDNQTTTIENFPKLKYVINKIEINMMWKKHYILPPVFQRGY